MVAMKIDYPGPEDLARFEACKQQILTSNAVRDGIGTLAEKTIHALLKLYIEPDTTCHEQAVAGFVADILNEEGVTEIQTGGFDRLRRKIDAFTPDYPLTVVYPVPAKKYLCWFDAETGELVSRRRSPKQGRATDVLKELYKIRPWLLEPGLKLHLYLMDLEEHRILDGWDRHRKKGSTRVDRLPETLDRVIRFEAPEDYLGLLPEGLPEIFRTKDVQALGGMTAKQAFIALRVLQDFGLVSRVGKDGRAHLYQILTA